MYHCQCSKGFEGEGRGARASVCIAAAVFPAWPFLTNVLLHLALCLAAQHALLVSSIHTLHHWRYPSLTFFCKPLNDCPSNTERGCSYDCHLSCQPPAPVLPPHPNVSWSCHGAVFVFSFRFEAWVIIFWDTPSWITDSLHRSKQCCARAVEVACVLNWS